MPVQSSQNGLQFLMNTQGQAQASSALEAVKLSQTSTGDSNEKGVKFAQVLKNSAVTEQNKNIAKTVNQSVLTAKNGNSLPLKKTAIELDAVINELPVSQDNDLQSVQISLNEQLVESGEFGQEEIEVKGSEVIKDLDINNTQKSITVDNKLVNQEFNLFETVKKTSVNEDSPNANLSIGLSKNDQVLINSNSISKSRINPDLLAKDVISTTKQSSTEFINPKSGFEFNLDNSASQIKYNNSEQIASEKNLFGFLRTAGKMQVNQTSINPQNSSELESFNVKLKEFNLSNKRNELTLSQFFGDDLDGLALTEPKSFLKDFKKMSELDVSINKNNLAGKDSESRDTTGTALKLTGSLIDKMNNNLESRLNGLSQSQILTQNMQQNELTGAIPMVAKLEANSETQMLKTQMNSMFQQGLNLKAEFTPNLAMRIQWMYKQALSSAEIMMDPPELGPLTVKINQHNGETSIVFHASHAATKDMLEDNLAKLKEMLNQQGINLGEALVEQQNQKSKGESKKSLFGSQDNSNKTDDISNDIENKIVSTSEKLLDVYS